eukprot:CAMPEP_0118933104 /NCGR_PEP_ID=MMETSP1169-20130426/11303_1 /TAXON_ID=36882 /ORGANISM="Pyramimonas obovata, Strain CCMP722" /LENGTH=137 /DNA_ID=CAMNT_0006875827 /DNA_START=197 /DNA_END=612 /DNA_ORIENTATION=-
MQYGRLSEGGDEGEEKVDLVAQAELCASGWKTRDGRGGQRGSGLVLVRGGLESCDLSRLLSMHEGSFLDDEGIVIEISGSIQPLNVRWFVGSFKLARVAIGRALAAVREPAMEERKVATQAPARQAHFAPHKKFNSK